MVVKCKCYKVWHPEHNNWHARFECPNGKTFGFTFYPDSFKPVVGETYTFEVSDKYYERITAGKTKEFY